MAVHHQGAVVSLASFLAALETSGIPYETIIHETRPWLYGPRPTVRHPWSGDTASGVFQVEEHATRGGSANAFTEYLATKNWMRNPNNPGASCTIIIGPEKVCIVVRPELQQMWCAGFGGPGRWTWSADGFAWAKENCQPRRDDPYHPGVIELGIQVNVVIARLTGIPVQRLILRDQAAWPPPTGWCGHEDYENGVKLGKSDPGPPYPWAYCMDETNRRLTALKGDEVDMATIRELEALIDRKLEGLDRLTRNLGGIGLFVQGRGQAAVYHLTVTETGALRRRQVPDPETFAMLGGDFGADGKWKNVREVDPVHLSHIMEQPAYQSVK